MMIAKLAVIMDETAKTVNDDYVCERCAMLAMMTEVTLTNACADCE